jgi:hypothetical protein
VAGGALLARAREEEANAFSSCPPARPLILAVGVKLEAVCT